MEEEALDPGLEGWKKVFGVMGNSICKDRGGHLE